MWSLASAFLPLPGQSHYKTPIPSLSPRRAQWAEGWPPKIYPPGTCACELIWKRVFADVIKDLKMKSSWVMWMGPKSNDKYACKRTQRKDRRGSNMRLQ